MALERKDGNIDQALETLREELKGYQNAQDDKNGAKTLHGIAHLLLTSRRPREAIQPAWEALKIFRELSDGIGAAGAVDIIVTAHYADGMPREALRVAKEEVGRFWSGGLKSGALNAAKTAIDAHLWNDDRAGALQMTRRALDMIDEQDWKARASVQHMAAMLEASIGHFNLAVQEADLGLHNLKTEGKGEPGKVEHAEQPPSYDETMDKIKQLAVALEEHKVASFEESMQLLHAAGGVDGMEAKQVTPVPGTQLAQILYNFEGGRDSQVYALREFQAMPADGRVSEMTSWAQTMGRITLFYILGDTNYDKDDIQVQMSKIAIEVKVADQVVKELTNDFFNQIRFPTTWWTVQTDTDPDTNQNRQTLVISISKRYHRAWSDIWYPKSAILNPARKGLFGWTQQMLSIVEEQENNKILKAMPPGSPLYSEDMYAPLRLDIPFAPKSDKYVCCAADIVLGIELMQDYASVTVVVDLDRKALEKFTKEISCEDLFGADVTSSSVYVFFKGDPMNPIMQGQLEGECDVSLTTWKMTTSEKARNRQQELAAAAPALAVRLVKRYEGEWPKVFRTVFQAPLMVKNPGELGELEQLLDALEKKADDSEETAEDDYAKEFEREQKEKEKAELKNKISNFQPERFDGLPEAREYRKKGYDMDADAFWEWTEDYVKDTMKRDGFRSAPRAIEVVMPQY